MEHDTSSIELAHRNALQRMGTARAAIMRTPIVDPETGKTSTLYRGPVDGDTLAHLPRHQPAQHGYYLATVDTHATLCSLRDDDQDCEAVA